MPVSTKINLSRYSGLINPEFQDPISLDQYEKLKLLIHGPTSRLISDNADKVYHATLKTASDPIAVAIKVFKRQKPWKDCLDKLTRSKAERSFLYASYMQSKKIGSPTPIACMENWQGMRLTESYYISAYQETSNFREELADILWHPPISHQRLIELITPIAKAVRHMHDSGFKHGDMGNQNIMLTAKDFTNIQFIDLNRGKIKPALSIKDRAFDLSRITLPTSYLTLFKQLYWGSKTYAKTFDFYENFYRKSFAWHTITRKYRHPIRSLLHPKPAEPAVYPDFKQLNIELN